VTVLGEGGYLSREIVGAHSDLGRGFASVGWKWERE